MPADSMAMMATTASEPRRASRFPLPSNESPAVPCEVRPNSTPALFVAPFSVSFAMTRSLPVEPDDLRRPVHDACDLLGEEPVPVVVEVNAVGVIQLPPVRGLRVQVDGVPTLVTDQRLLYGM